MTGEKVTIATRTGFDRATAVAFRIWTVVEEEDGFEYRANDGFSGLCWYAHEGVVWCRGWDGEAVEALKAAVALTREVPRDTMSLQKELYGELLEAARQRA